MTTRTPLCYYSEAELKAELQKRAARRVEVAQTEERQLAQALS